MRFVSALVLTVLLAANSFAQFTAGNIVVMRVGDGSTSLTANTAPLFLDEYTTSGTLVQSIAIPATGSNKMTATGNSSTEGGITRSVDGRYITLCGYDAVAATASVSTGTAATYNRVVARLDALANYDASTRLTDAYNGSNIRGAVTTNGTDIWTSGNGGSGQGSSAATRYTTLGATTSTLLHSTASNIRWVNIFNGQLYVTSSTSSGGGLYGVSTIGTGMPTTSGQSITALSGMPLTGTHSAYGFAISPDGNTLYMGDDGAVGSGGGIQKWTLSAGTWSLAYTLLNNGTTTTSVRGICVDWSGTNPVVYATTSITSLIKVVDTGSGSTATTLATAGSNTAFRGVAFAPYATETFANGSTYNPPNGTPNTNDNPIGRFQLSGNINGGTLTSVTVTLTGANTGITNLKLYSSSSSSFSVGSSTLLASTSTIGATATLTISGGHSIPAAGEYYFVAADLNSSASGRVLISVASESALTFTNAGLYSTFSNQALSMADVPLPVTATAMYARVNAGKVLVNFSTGTEVSLTGFNIYRATAQEGPYEFVSGYESNKLLTAKGTVTTGGSYSFVDSKVIAGNTYFYKIEAVNKSGVSEQMGGIISVEVTVPKNFAVYQNYPNPFNPSTTLRYDLKEPASVKVEVYNALGVRVAALDLGTIAAGTHETMVNLSYLSSGVYYYKILIAGESGANFVSTKKMLMVK